MALFDATISKAQEKFNLDDKASVLLSALLALMADQNRGGLTGFLNKFNEAGLDDLSSAWVSSGTTDSLSDKETELIFGKDSLKDISNQTNINYGKIVSVTAFMLPYIIGALTPDGAVPGDDDFRLKINEFLIENSATSPAAGKTVEEGINYVEAAEVETGYGIGNDLSTDDSILKWLLPLIIFVLLVTIGFRFCGQSNLPAPTDSNKAGNMRQ